MKNFTKKDILLAGCSFAAGLIIMGAANKLCGCSLKNAAEKPFSPAQIEAPFARKGVHPDFRKDASLQKNRAPKKFHGEKRPHERMVQPRGNMTEHLSKVLDLSDEQKAKIEEFRRQDMAEFNEIAENMKALRAKADEIRARGKERFESILTDEQKVKLQQVHDRFKSDAGRADKMERPHCRADKHPRMIPNRQAHPEPTPITLPEPPVAE